MEIIVNQMERRSWIEIDLDQIKQNYFIYKNSLQSDAEIMAVIKADAYGHGDAHIARWLSEQGCRLFAVSNIDEAVGLRNAGIKGEILILGYTSPKYAKTLSYLDLSQAIVSEEYAEALSQTGQRVKCQFAIDTGMNRIGLDGDNTSSCEEIIRKYSDSLIVEGLFTHLCVADTESEDAKEFTYGQIRKFKAVADAVADLKLPYVHCCNSAGGLYYLKNNSEFEVIGKIVRLGIVLYGLKPDADNQLPDGVRPAMTWKSVVSMVKNVHPGETIGYGRTFMVKKEMKVATVTTGYADGLNRLLSNKGFVMINGCKAPIVGRICMDQTLVDVTEIPEVNMGDEVVIIGENGDLTYTADDMAQDLGTIGYEVICNITKRVQRFYCTHGLLYAL
ncbi:MAG: alanine racemase [Acetatifactor sp.]